MGYRTLAIDAGRQVPGEQGLRAGIDRSKSSFRTHSPARPFGVNFGTARLRVIPVFFRTPVGHSVALVSSAFV